MYGSQPEIKKRAAFILACAGSGKRMDLREPKQFLEYRGKPLFLRALFCAETSDWIGEIVIVTQLEYISYVKECCYKEGFQKVSAIIQGGKERQDSIFKGIQAIQGEYPYIIVQDAVRPFCKEKYFQMGIRALEEGYAGAVVGVPVKDTIKQCNEQGEIIGTPDRSLLFAAHTPQIFRKEVLIKSYEYARQEKFLGTDDASLVERRGYPVKAILGDEDNIKITVPEDLKFLKD